MDPAIDTMIDLSLIAGMALWIAAALCGVAIVAACTWMTVARVLAGGPLFPDKEGCDG